MLKLLEQYQANGMTVELFQTDHTGPSYHVRYGLQIHGYATLDGARDNFQGCIEHIRQLGD